MFLYILGTHPEVISANWDNVKMFHGLYRHWQSIPDELVLVAITFP